MSEVVWIDGRFIERDEARVSAFDAGLQHGVGLFETMLATRGRVYRLERHLSRLAGSAAELGLTLSLRTEALADAVMGVLDRSGLAEGDESARIRLTLTGGDLNLLETRAQSQTNPTIMISASPATKYPDEMFEKGVGVLIAGVKANPLNEHDGHKTLNYWWRLRALQEAASLRMGEALILQVTNYVCGGTVSNLFTVREGSLVTPLARGEEEQGALGSPVLPGITREAIIELADRAGIGCAKRMMTIEDVLDADEVFLTNSSWGVLPVVGVEAEPIGDGKPGEMTCRLRKMWLEELVAPR